ncbi:hypothetical protein OESDEN_22560 [Oesophagostomum dentatum]|uniref:Uncharacterized protein n=1 Tax=Oesophagostomum dentatum TaxID=61180 RepID=A0A0B1S3M5_OESDE|nr:hypothetical protein OESDEN_22560 [Oesophagostomum dentatum]
MLRSEIPRDVLERAGFLSANAATDIASRLQIAFERILPKGLQCRIVLMPEMSEPGSAFMRVEWFGKNEALNHTKMQWHTGRAEKACSPYINKLSDYFSLSESPRFQLVLSSVKQLKVSSPYNLFKGRYFQVVSRKIFGHSVPKLSKISTNSCT